MSCDGCCSNAIYFVLEKTGYWFVSFLLATRNRIYDERVQWSAVIFSPHVHLYMMGCYERTDVLWEVYKLVIRPEKKTVPKIPAPFLACPLLETTPSWMFLINSSSVALNLYIARTTSSLCRVLMYAFICLEWVASLISFQVSAKQLEYGLPLYRLCRKEQDAVELQRSLHWLYSVCYITL